MSTPNKGERVYALRDIDDKTQTVHLYGYGVYEGDYQPDSAGGDTAEMVHRRGDDNPRIKLDNGKIVWGCECWWGPEQEFKDRASQFTVVEVDIEQDRKEAEELS